MKKSLDIEELDDEELSEYLAKNAEEDLVADDTTPDDDGYDVKAAEAKKESSIPIDESKARVTEEIEMQPEAERKRMLKRQAKLEKKLYREKQKKIKEHRKNLKKNPSTLVRYEPDLEFGLPKEIVEQRILDELVNETGKKKTKSIGRILFSNIVTFFNILIFIIAGILIGLAIVYKRFEPITDLSFFLIVIINIVIGVIQEIRAKKMIDSLSLMNAPYAIVRREGMNKEIYVNEVVLDDLLLLESGNQICADSIVVEGQVEVNESLLTGESDAIIKKPGDQLLSGSFIVSGKCKARVDKIGKDNYIETLSAQAKVYKKPKSDLLISLGRIIKFMAIPVIIVGVFLFIRMYYNGDVSFFDTVRKTSGAMVGMIPSGLFLMSSIALYVGVLRLGQKNVLVQELYCIEMLARVNCICLDKTGTITDGTMVVKNVIDYNQVAGLATKNIVSAILNALPDRNMTSEALIQKFGLGKRMKSLATIPFSSQRKFQAVTFDHYGTFLLGAPEFVLQEQYKKVSKDVEKYAKLGFRVLCLAYKEGNIVNDQLPEGEIEVISMILIEDNIRPDAISTINYFKNSGVEVRVISGDNPITVSKIAQRAGVPNANNYISLDGLTDVEVARAALKYNVFGRVSPNQKKIIVQTLKKNDMIVAMTGDGVNDILALREADCSIALGSGSDATRNCSHLVLTDSNFGSMPQVVAEGRRVINNVTSVASLFLTKTIFSLLLGIVAIFTGVYPITPKQLILIDILGIGLPSLFLVNEPNNNPVSGRFLPNVIKKALPGALVIVILCVMIFMLTDSLNLDSLSLTTIVVIVATHTSLMVLFKACRPFTTMRKIICTFSYAVFLIAIFALPNLLELKPLIPPVNYYSETAKFTSVAEYPSVKVSEENYYVVDGVVISLKTDNNYESNLLSRYDSEDSNYYYAINGYKISTEITIPDLSYDKYGSIYLGGYEMNDLSYYDGIENDIIVDSNGKLYLKDYTTPLYTTLKKSDDYYNFNVEYGNYKEKEARVQYSILPKVKVDGNKYIINGEKSSDGAYYVEASIGQILDDDLEIKIDTETLELLINGKTISKTYTDGTVGETYKVTLPTVSTCGNKRTSTSSIVNTVYFGAVNAGINIFQVYGKKSDVSAQTGLTGSYSYTISNIDGKTTYDYVYYQSYDKIYKVESGSEVDIDNDEFENFRFLDFMNNDFKAYYDLNGDSIDVNNALNPLTVDVKYNSSVYSLIQNKSETNIFDVDALVSLNNTQFAPTIAVTEANHYIINDYYTEYEASYDEVKLAYYSLNDTYYLKVNGSKTNYELDASVIVGGMVTSLNLTNQIFLVMLCLAAAPLMRLLQYIFPWLRKQMENFQKIVNKW